MKTQYPHFQRAMINARYKIGLSQRQLARKLNVSLANISYLETQPERLGLPMLRFLNTHLTNGANGLMRCRGCHEGTRKGTYCGWLCANAFAREQERIKGGTQNGN